MLLVDIGAVCMPLYESRSELHLGKVVQEKRASWGIGSRVAFIIIFNILTTKYGYSVMSDISAETASEERRIHSPPALKKRGDDLSARAHSPHRVCFSESDVIVLSEGQDPCGRVQPVSQSARGESIDRLPSSAPALAAATYVEGLGMTGIDVMNLFTSIVEQEACTDIAAGVIKNLERTEVALIANI